MYSAVLVAHAIEEGQRLLERLKKERFPVSAALWYHVPDSSHWVLVIATPVVSRVGPTAAYTRLQGILQDPLRRPTWTSAAGLGPDRRHG